MPTWLEDVEGLSLTPFSDEEAGRAALDLRDIMELRHILRFNAREGS